MFKRLFLVFCLLVLVSQSAFANIELLSPVKAVLSDDASIQAGFIEPNQVFDLIFSDNSGYGFEWNNVSVDKTSLPNGWSIVSTDITDTSLIVSIKVPENASPNFYNLNVLFSNDLEPAFRESINVRVVVKQNLLDVSFTRISPESLSVVGSEIPYKVVLTNSSIASYPVVVSSTLPVSWFSERTLVVKPNEVPESDLVVVPQIYGKKDFSFQAKSVNSGLVVKSFSSELNVLPTLKGKFSSAFGGFPFFTFSLLPFQMFDSFFGLVLAN